MYVLCDKIRHQSKNYNHINKNQQYIVCCLSEVWSQHITRPNYAGGFTHNTVPFLILQSLTLYINLFFCILQTPLPILHGVGLLQQKGLYGYHFNAKNILQQLESVMCHPVKVPTVQEFYGSYTIYLIYLQLHYFAWAAFWCMIPVSEICLIRFSQTNQKIHHRQIIKKYIFDENYCRVLYILLHVIILQKSLIFFTRECRNRERICKPFKNFLQGNDRMGT